MRGNAIERVPSLGASAAYLKQHMRNMLIEHKHYIDRYGRDMPEIRDWTWSSEHGSTASH